MTRLRAKKALKPLQEFVGLDDEVAIQVALNLLAVDTDAAALEACSPLLDAKELAVWKEQFERAREQGTANGFEEWRAFQAKLRAWIAAIARYPLLSAAKAAALRAEVSDYVFPEPDSLTQVVDPLRIGRSGFEIKARGIRRLLWATAGLLVPGGVDPRRLARCQLTSCRRWFLRPRTQPGTVTLFCSKAHGGLARQQAYRARQRAKDST